MPTELTLKKQAKRAEIEERLGRTIMALPNKKFGIIYADPPWAFRPFSKEGGMEKAAENYYVTLDMHDISGMDIRKIAYKDCVLFLWATVPMLAEAMHVMRMWGFEYKSNFVWIKPTVGTGYWSRNRHELLLVGTRGDVPAPAMGTQWESAQESERALAHSAKPELFYSLIEEYFPNLPKIELFARNRREGWDSWGNEV